MALLRYLADSSSRLLLIFLFMKPFIILNFLLEYNQFFPVFFFTVSALCIFQDISPTVCMKYFVLFTIVDALKFCFLHLSSPGIYFCECELRI